MQHRWLPWLGSPLPATARFAAGLTAGERLAVQWAYFDAFLRLVLEVLQLAGKLLYAPNRQVVQSLQHVADWQVSIDQASVSCTEGATCWSVVINLPKGCNGTSYMPSDM